MCGDEEEEEEESYYFIVLILYDDVVWGEGRGAINRKKRKRGGTLLTDVENFSRDSDDNVMRRRRGMRMIISLQGNKKVGVGDNQSLLMSINVIFNSPSFCSIFFPFSPLSMHSVFTPTPRVTSSHVQPTALLQVCPLQSAPYCTAVNGNFLMGAFENGY